MHDGGRGREGRQTLRLDEFGHGGESKLLPHLDPHETAVHIFLHVLWAPHNVIPQPGALTQRSCRRSRTREWRRTAAEAAAR